MARLGWVNEFIPEMKTFYAYLEQVEMFIDVREDEKMPVAKYIISFTQGLWQQGYHSLVNIQQCLHLEC